MHELPADLVARTLQAAVFLAAPPVLAAALTGVLVGVAQAITQIQDQALALALRLLAVALTLWVTGPWAFEELIALTTRLFQLSMDA